MAQKEGYLNQVRDNVAIEFAKVIIGDEQLSASISSEATNAGQPFEKILAQRAIKFANALTCQIQKAPFETWHVDRNNPDHRKAIKTAIRQDRENNKPYHLVKDGNK